MCVTCTVKDFVDLYYLHNDFSFQQLKEWAAIKMVPIADIFNGKNPCKKASVQKIFNAQFSLFQPIFIFFTEAI